MDFNGQNASIWHLHGRSCLAVTGDEAEAFLNDLLTLDITTIPDDCAVPAALLSPQGRIIFDLLISRIANGFRVECDLSRIKDLEKKFRLYRLRRPVDFTLLEEQVCAIVGDIHHSDYHKDSRFHNVSVSRYYHATAPAYTDASVANIMEYQAFRYQHGIPEGKEELIPEKALPLEAGIDKHGAISFDKGCFIGQEVTARTRYKGLLKRRYTAFHSKAKIAFPADIRADDKLVGETLGLAREDDCWIGLANIRLDALASGQMLMVGEDEIIPISHEQSSTKA